MGILYQLQLTLQFIPAEAWHLLYQKMKRKTWTSEEKNRRTPSVASDQPVPSVLLRITEFKEKIFFYEIP